MNQSITLIQQELARQIHFRGYYLLNADIINLASSVTGDFAFSAESGTVWMYESSWYDSGQLVPDQVTPASDELPIVDGETSAGVSTSYNRGDHIHLQQLTYDRNITATKFIKTGGTNQQILLTNGDTTTIDSKLSRSYSSEAGEYIRLCVFPLETSTGAPYIQFQVTCNTNAMQTFDLVLNCTVNGIVDLYAWIHMMTGSGGVTVTVSKQSSYWATRVTEILTQDIVTSISGMCYFSYKYYSIRLMGDNVGLSINSDSSIVKFNGNELVNVGTDQTITGRKTFAGVTLGNIQLNPTDISYGEGLRIVSSPIGNISAIYIGTSTSSSGATDGQFTIIKRTDGSLIISRTADQNTDNRGLQISADGNTLTFNGSVIAGTGTTNGASNGSVNYSAGNQILWRQNSTDPIGGIYSDGDKVYWRAHPLTMGSVPP
ncbi:MAG: hypothetical protein EZS28_031710 [Streblomastix strix]|uniref:Uncharacterized protein n=1 Tax=Streblomastix strix TaxID=222440 RepID=A0A5J4UR07_9EUKA|nr:MAG: hypothetical protein EZS28_031710 [Streblomastix strix]